MHSTEHTHSSSNRQRIDGTRSFETSLIEHPLHPSDTGGMKIIFKQVEVHEVR